MQYNNRTTYWWLWCPALRSGVSGRVTSGKIKKTDVIWRSWSRSDNGVYITLPWQNLVKAGGDFPRTCYLWLNKLSVLKYNLIEGLGNTLKNLKVFDRRIVFNTYIMLAQVWGKCRCIISGIDCLIDMQFNMNKVLLAWTMTYSNGKALI